jgi:hypothetical protein
LVIVCSEKQISAGNKGDITFMCRPAVLQMMKHGNEAIGSKVNFPLENCLIGIEAAQMLQRKQWRGLKKITLFCVLFLALYAVFFQIAANAECFYDSDCFGYCCWISGREDNYNVWRFSCIGEFSESLTATLRLCPWRIL